MKTLPGKDLSESGARGPASGVEKSRCATDVEDINVANDEFFINS
jgi:hypothetical protein